MKKWIELIALIAALICGMTIRASDSTSEPRRVEIEAKRFAFTPDELTLTKDQPIVLIVKSDDVEHGMIFPDLGLELKVPKGGTGEMKFTPDKTGDFIGRCSVFCGVGHGGMTITLHVVD